MVLEQVNHLPILANWDLKGFSNFVSIMSYFSTINNIFNIFSIDFWRKLIKQQVIFIGMYTKIGEIGQKQWEKWKDRKIKRKKRGRRGGIASSKVLGTILSKNNDAGYFLNNFQVKDSLAIGVILGDI